MDRSDAQKDYTDWSNQLKSNTEGPDPFDLSHIDVVHKFSNLLTIVLSNLERLRRQCLNDAGRKQLAQAEEAAYQAGILLHRNVSKR